MIIVSGASGFIGGAILKSQGVKGIGLSRSQGKSKKNSFCVVELTDAEQVNKLITTLSKEPVEAFIHCAGITPWSDKVPNYSKDQVMAENVLNICKALSIKRLIYISGWVVYDSLSPVPYQEDKTPLIPATEYGRSKLRVEEYLKQKAKNVQVINLRLATIYGEGQTPSGLIYNLIKNSIRGEGIELNSKTTKRDYYYIDDLVKTINNVLKMNYPQNLDINIGSGTSYAVSKVAESIKDLVYSFNGTSTAISYAESKTEASPGDNLLSVEQASELEIIAGNTDFKTGLNNYISWLNNENLL
jgi:nucleoside-diphosphate-sugar epimerase